MIRLKTAVLLACSLKTGAIIAGASAENCEAIYRFGEKIGLAFQLKDDLLDTFGNEEVFGKAIGGDIACNKKTFLWIHALLAANDEQKAEVDSWVAKADFDRGEKVSAIRRIYEEIGVKEICEKKMDAYFEEAMDALHSLEVNMMQKSEIIHLTEQLMKREV
jgi:geranylgeranyl diphosphate synthase type II